MMTTIDENNKNKGGRPKAEPGTAFTVKVSYADMDFIDAAAKRLGVSRGVLIKRAVEAYVDPLSRLQEAAKATDQMRADMREMRSLTHRIFDLISRVGMFITSLYAADNEEKQEAEAESAREFFTTFDYEINESSSSTPDVQDDAAEDVEDDDAMGYER